MNDFEPTRAHDLACALNVRECRHEAKAIKFCVICHRMLKRSVHLDTCSTPCFKALLELQRRDKLWMPWGDPEIYS